MLVSKFPVALGAAVLLLGVPAVCSAQTAPSPSPLPTPSAAPSSAAPAAAPALSPAASPAAPTPTPSPTPVVQLSGYGDFSFTTFNGSPLLVGGAVTTRIFDKYQNVPTLQAIDLQGSLNTPIGAVVELMAGTDANGYASTGQSTTAGFNVIQSYAKSNIGPVQVLLGKYNTLAGYEVNDSPLNPNFSRSYQFAYGEPFTNTGVRLIYAAPSGKYTLDAGVNNGWDNWQFIGQGLTAELSALVNISPAFSIQAVTYNGREFTFPPSQPNIVRGNRMLYDFIGTIHATPALTLVGVYDNATQLETCAGPAEPGVTPLCATPDGAPNAKWNSLGGYAEYTFSSLFGLNLRGETFDDVNGYRTGFAPSARVNSGTVTFAYTPSSHYLFRLEGRRDNVAGTDVPYTAGFPLANGGYRSNQTSIALEGIIKF